MQAMKPLALSLALLFTPLAAKAKTMTNTDLPHRIQTLEDRAALKELVDTFSILADVKDIDRQVLLFTPDATVDSFSDGKQTTALKGRQQIGEVFKEFLGRFSTVHHMNGQQTVVIKGDTATGIAYCQVVLTGMQDGRQIRTTMGVTYHDDFVRRGGTWLIAHRMSNFVWVRREVMDA
jgi:hypothetical protein